MLVAKADRESAVTAVMAFEKTTMARAPKRPAWPTTQPIRRYMMTPRIVSAVGVKTPRKVPSFGGTAVWPGVLVRPCAPWPSFPS